MTSRIVNLDAVTAAPLPDVIAPPASAADRYAPRVAMVGRMVGTEKLGCNLIVVAPGKRAFPFHSHRTNEELYLVLSGAGEVRLGSLRHPVSSGDLIAAPAGGPDTAHQIINTGEVDLRYLVISTQESPDIIQYPHTGKFRVLDCARGDAGFDVHRAAADPSVDYWEGE